MTQKQTFSDKISCYHFRVLLDNVPFQVRTGLASKIPEEIQSVLQTPVFLFLLSNYPLAVAGTCPLNFCWHCVTVTVNDSTTVSAYFKDHAVKKDVL